MLGATSNLLGSTIGFSEEDWARPSALPGWTRAHVAAHLADNAEALRRLIAHLLQGDPRPLYGDDAERDAAIQLGATRESLDLQIALDTSAGQLAAALHDMPVAFYEVPVSLGNGVEVPARALALVRLTEVVLHHWDLQDGFTLADLDMEAVLWCLQLKAHVLRGRRGYPSIRLIADEGLDVVTGRPGAPELARGDARSLLGWLTGRGPAPSDHHRWANLPLS